MAVQSPAFAGVDVRVCALDLEVIGIIGGYWRKNRGTKEINLKSNAVAMRSWRCFHDDFYGETLRFQDCASAVLKTSEKYLTKTLYYPRHLPVLGW